MQNYQNRVAFYPLPSKHFFISLLFFKLLCGSTCLHAALKRDDSSNGSQTISKGVKKPCSEKSAASFFVFGEYLYWQPNISSLELSFGSSSIIQGVVEGISLSKTAEFDVDPSFGWSSGYRVGLGWRGSPRPIAFEAVWTQYRGRGDRIIQTQSNTNQGRVDLSFEQIDAAVAYLYRHSCIKLEPFVGVRATKINHSLKSSVTTDITLLPSTPAHVVFKFNDSQRFKGIGPSLGLYGDWTIGSGFGLYVEAAYAVLYGNYSVNFNDSSLYSAPLSTQSITKTRKHLHRYNEVVDLGLGLFWRTINTKKVGISIGLGYELHEYYNLSYLGANRGDITFNGMVVSFELAF